MTLNFEKTSIHPQVSLLHEKMAEAKHKESMQNIFKKLPKDFNAESSALFYSPGEDYLEWIDIVEAVSSAKDRFVMFELGAGYGRWCLNAMHALKYLNPIPFHFVAVEAEPSHFRFLKAFFLAHDLSLKDHCLIEAAIDTTDGHAQFHTGDPNGWYGQCIAEKKPDWRDWTLHFRKKIAGTFRKHNQAERGIRIVKTISLNTLLKNYEKVDLIDMDIQGAELPVLQGSMAQIDEKVKRLHIGTHSKEIDESLEALFIKHGWKNFHLYPTFGTAVTPYGKITFNDGVQSWVNTRLL